MSMYGIIILVSNHKKGVYIPCHMAVSEEKRKRACCSITVIRR
jgi:hypothetical protein